MASEKCRYIATSFWDDEWVQKLDPSEKLLYLYFLTNPLTNIAGIYKITIRRMCFDTGFNTDTIEHILDKFEKAGKAYFFNGWLVLPNWPKHQKIGKNDNNRKGIDTILKELPEEIFQFIIRCGYTYQYIDEIERVIQAPYKPLASPLQGASNPHVSTSNYYNLNSNLNSNSNSSAPSAADADAPLADPDIYIEESKKRKTKALVPKTDNSETQLYHKIQQSFESVFGQFANYGKEGAAIKRIIKLTNGEEPAIQKMIECYLSLIHGQNRFWQGQPFTPSALVAVWDRVKVEAYKDIEHELSWAAVMEEARHDVH